ncbi:MAG: PAS domain-containing protein [Elusimicrobia bacterium]|nr:PAS domain-containing protein [Elusimicrobiota bacterium]
MGDETAAMTPPSIPPCFPFSSDEARGCAYTANHDRILAREAGESRERLEFLVSAVQSISDSVDLGGALHSLCAAAVPRLGQWCSITLRSGEDLAAPQVWHDDPDRVRLLQSLADIRTPSGDRRDPVRRVLDSGRSEFVARTPPDFNERLAVSPEHLTFLQELGVASYMCVPLRSHGKTLGVMTLGADSGWRPLSRTDLVIAEQLAARAGAAIEKAQLHQAVENELAERRRAESALRRQEAEQAVILDTVRAMIWYKDADNRILRCNRAAARWLGKTVEQVQGRRGEELFPLARAREYHANDLAVIASGKARIGELEELRLRGGAKRWVQRDTLPYRNEKGAIIGVVIIAVDVTKRKRAEDLAVAKERAEREFVANVSHEFRTPVAAIKGFTQTLREGAWRNPEDRAAFLDIIESNADRLDAMLGDLLTLSALEGSAPLRPGTVDLNAVARDRVRKILPRAARKGLAIAVSVPRGLRVKMNQAHLGQALGHLIDNAVKFTPPGGWVKVKARGSKGGAVIVVEDSGIGIPRAELPRVFDRFFRVAKGAQSGSPGLGLHLVKKLVGAYGGRVSARSRLARGSAFSVALPAAAAGGR